MAKALNVFTGGSVMGLSVVGLGVTWSCWFICCLFKIWEFEISTQLNVLLVFH